MQNYVFELYFKVRDYECDLQGVVNNAVYQSYLEHARHEYLLTKKVSFNDLVKNDILLMVSRIEMDFKNSLRSGDEFYVKLRTERLGIKLLFFQDIYRVSDNALCLKAKIDVISKINSKLTRGEIFDDLEV
jgi:acyl-CoA thioester hydrolase